MRRCSWGGAGSSASGDPGLSPQSSGMGAATSRPAPSGSPDPEGILHPLGGSRPGGQPRVRSPLIDEASCRRLIRKRVPSDGSNAPVSVTSMRPVPAGGEGGNTGFRGSARDSDLDWACTRSPMICEYERRRDQGSRSSGECSHVSFGVHVAIASAIASRRTTTSASCVRSDSLSRHRPNASYLQDSPPAGLVVKVFTN